MELINIKIIDYKQNEEKFEKYKSKLENIKALLKENKKDDSIYESLNSLNNKNIYLYFLLFQNYDKWININFENNINDAKKFELIMRSFKFSNTENDIKINMYSLLINWLFYLYNEFINYLYEILVPNYSEINKIRFILRETNNIIVKLYKINILTTYQIFNIMNFSIFLMETNFEVKSYSDRLYKAKNYLLLQGLFLLLEQTSIIIINKANLNKPDEENENKINIQNIISFLKDFQNNSEINSQLIMMILINKNLIQSFMVKIIEQINIKIIVKYEPEIKNKLLNFFVHFIKYNYQKSKIFNSFLYTLKKSFINLYNFENNKDKILHDLFINSFYVKLLKKIMIIDRNLLLPPFDTFYFNGYDSQISLNVQNNTFEKSTLFFSFYLLPLERIKQYPLFLVQKDFDRKKNDLLYLYLEKSLDNTKNTNKDNYELFDLHISFEGKVKKLNNFPKIKSNTTYYFSLTFNLNKLLITFFNRKEEVYSTEIDKNNKLLAINSISLSFGFYKKRVNVFSGYFGPIIMIRNPKNSKELNDFISLILKNNYHNILFLNPNANYFSEEEIYFIKSTKKEYDSKYDKNECLLYLVPDTFRFFSEKSKVVNHLPDIDSICKIQRNYNIYILNITLIKYDKGIINFIMNNGFDYICFLYEYIYQFVENYLKGDFPSFKEDKDLFTKMISSIFKKTLFILEKIYNEINVPNFNKSLKQIYYNLFSCIKLINKKYYIIDDLIDYFFYILKYYYSNISHLLKKERNFSFDIRDSTSIDFSNNNLIKMNLCFMNGLVDFLLKPELYSFNNKQIFLKLFIQLASFFDYIQLNKESEQINQHLYLKLLGFIPILNKYFIETNLDKDNDENKIIKNNSREIDIFNAFFKVLKKYFENNPSRSENIKNLKDIFMEIDNNLKENDQTFFKFNNFINELISDNPDLYFSDDENDEQIKHFIKYAGKFSNFNNEKEGNKNEKQIANKRNLFYKLISILIRIIFTKRRMGRSSKIIKRFKNLINKVEKTNELIITVTTEIINIINNILQKKNKIKVYTYEDLQNLSNYYFEIFNLILIFLEYPFDKKKNDLINNEKIIIELLEQIANMLKSIIDNDNDIDNNNNNDNDNYNLINLENDNRNFIDIIYLLINFLKFYNNIFFKKLYSVKFIQNFINICKLCCDCGLIHSNILIEAEENSYITKTPLEIILDICIFYVNLSSSKYCENLSENEINKDTIIEEQNIIYTFLKDLFRKYKNSKENDFTIFYINDIFRLLSSVYPIDGKKRPKNDSFYKLFKKAFHNYQYIDKLLVNEKKFNFNFSTFFILKCTGYKKILFELIVKVLLIEPNAKDILKFDDILTLLIEVLQKNYDEHEILYSKNKNFYFKKSNTSYYYYSEIKKRIENNLKNNYSELDSYILNKIFNKDFDNLYTLVYSGCCINKKQTQHKYSDSDKMEKEGKEMTKIQKVVRHAFSSTNLIKQLLGDKEIEKTSGKKMTKPSTKSIFYSPKNDDNSSEKESSSNQDDFDFELHVEEEPASANIKHNDFEDINTDLSIYSSPLNFQRSQKKKSIVSSFLSLSDSGDTSEKKSRNYRKASMFDELSIDNNETNNLSYINYIIEPDECFIKNYKKEFMMTVFSIYFFDTFFINKNFLLMKNYYLQNFDGIEKSTKLLDYPSKIKNFNNGLEPCLFLKPFPSFFRHKIFPITHKYFYNYMEKNNLQYEPIILFKKKLPDFYLEDKFDKKCELIKIDHSYYGHIIGSRNVNYIIFEQQNYDFYDEPSDSDTNKTSNKKDLNNLFTLSNINKKPKKKPRKLSSYLNEEQRKPFEYNKKFKTEKTLIILYDEIEEILERRFLLMWQAIEIYLKNGKSYFFNFITKDQYEFILDVFKNNDITKNKIHEKDFFNNYYKYLITEWQEERLSTYEYLLLVNKYSSRTFNDVNQYPIFPWLVRKYKIDKENNNLIITQRNFNYPMGGQTEDNRVSAINRYEDDEESKVNFPVHYGTHYSTSSYIYFYLMREEPYTSLLVKLQGYKQENPDRMFFSLIDTLFVLECGSDNRECIPDIFCKIEQFINLNCSDFGCKNNGLRVDDFLIYRDSNDLKSINIDNSEINNYVQFIIENKKLLDTKNISVHICDWFDIIFGVNQLPEKNMKKSYNIFNKHTYEQKNNLYGKLIKLINKHMKEEEIIKKIQNKIDLIISFGQTPYQLFNEKHPKNEHKKQKKEKVQHDDEDDEDDFESNLDNIVWEKNIKGVTDIQPLFFELNISLGKIFLINSKRELEIIDSNYYDFNGDSKSHFKFNKNGVYQLFHIKFFEKVKIQDNSKYLYHIINPKYSFSSFDDGEIINNSDSNHNEYISYYNSYLSNLKSKRKKKTNKEEYIKFVTCRYMDNSFKIYFILKNKQKIEKEIKPISIICEDFVSSCCTLNHNQFLVGLKNGKLIQWSIENEIDKEKKQNYKVIFNRQIQAHKKTITFIEIYIKLGIIITGGEDNYIFIRKIYDFELITPIRIKSKYVITMAKVSPMNFLYVICFNKKKNKNKSIIFGYTLNGLYFAKSKYGYFDNIDFTRNGNIITYNSKKGIEILSGYNLNSIIKNQNDKDMEEVKKKINGASYIKFNYFSRKNDIEPILNKIITFTIYDKNRGGNLIETFDVTSNKYFE